MTLICIRFSLLLISIAGVAYATLVQAQAAPVVLELFTSEGCSSCPPADELLGELEKRPGVIALAFHVDYWDGLGWRDPFALSLSAQRQARYVTVLGLPSSFTPQLVINGRRSLIGSNRGAVIAALGQPETLLPIKAEMDGAQLIVTLEAGPMHDQWELNLVAYRPQAQTAVPRGENRGRTLTEFNIVRSFRTVATGDGSTQLFTVPVATLPADATRVALLLQEVGGRSIVGAADIQLR